MRSRLRLRRRRFNLGKAMFILPNLFTVSSIFCGFYAAVTAAGAAGDSAGRDLYRACLAVLFAMVFDSVDGRVARLTRTQSEFGVQMDSLADVISFGVAPALIAWHFGLQTFGTAGLVVCFVYTACGTIRLARFNVMAAHHSGPSEYFLGLPIPAGAGLLVAVIIALLRGGTTRLTGDEWWPPGFMVLLGGLMVSNIRFRTFKATRMNRRALAGLLTVVGATLLVAVRSRPSVAIVVLMGAYLVAGLVEESLRLFRRLTATTTPERAAFEMREAAEEVDEDDPDTDQDGLLEDEQEELLD